VALPLLPGGLPGGGHVRKQKLWLGLPRSPGSSGVGAIIGMHWLCLSGVSWPTYHPLAGIGHAPLFTRFTEHGSCGRRIGPSKLLGLLVSPDLLIAGWKRSCTGSGRGTASALLAAVSSCSIAPSSSRGNPMVDGRWTCSPATVVCLLAVPVFDSAGFASLVIPDAPRLLWIGSWPSAARCLPKP